MAKELKPRRTNEQKTKPYDSNVKKSLEERISAIEKILKTKGLM
jgi:hypothetical protein